MIDHEPELTKAEKAAIWTVATMLAVVFFAVLNIFGIWVLG